MEVYLHQNNDSYQRINWLSSIPQRLNDKLCDKVMKHNDLGHQIRQQNLYGNRGANPVQVSVDVRSSQMKKKGGDCEKIPQQPQQRRPKSQMSSGKFSSQNRRGKKNSFDLKQQSQSIDGKRNSEAMYSDKESQQKRGLVTLLMRQKQNSNLRNAAQIGYQNYNSIPLVDDFQQFKTGNQSVTGSRKSTLGELVVVVNNQKGAKGSASQQHQTIAHESQKSYKDVKMQKSFSTKNINSSQNPHMTNAFRPLTSHNNKHTQSRQQITYLKMLNNDQQMVVSQSQPNLRSLKYEEGGVQDQQQFSLQFMVKNGRNQTPSRGSVSKNYNQHFNKNYNKKLLNIHQSSATDLKSIQDHIVETLQKTPQNYQPDPSKKDSPPKRNNKQILIKNILIPQIVPQQAQFQQPQNNHQVLDEFLMQTQNSTQRNHSKSGNKLLQLSRRENRDNNGKESNRSHNMLQGNNNDLKLDEDKDMNGGEKETIDGKKEKNKEKGGDVQDNGGDTLKLLQKNIKQRQDQIHTDPQNTSLLLKPSVLKPQLFDQDPISFSPLHINFNNNSKPQEDNQGQQFPFKGQNFLTQYQKQQARDCRQKSAYNHLRKLRQQTAKFHNKSQDDKAHQVGNGLSGLIQRERQSTILANVMQQQNTRSQKDQMVSQHVVDSQQQQVQVVEVNKNRQINIEARRKPSNLSGWQNDNLDDKMGGHGHHSTMMMPDATDMSVDSVAYLKDQYGTVYKPSNLPQTNLTTTQQEYQTNLSHFQHVTQQTQKQSNNQSISSSKKQYFNVNMNHSTSQQNFSQIQNSVKSQNHMKHMALLQQYQTSGVSKGAQTHHSQQSIRPNTTHSHNPYLQPQAYSGSIDPQVISQQSYVVSQYLKPRKQLKSDKVKVQEFYSNEKKKGVQQNGGGKNVPISGEQKVYVLQERFSKEKISEMMLEEKRNENITAFNSQKGFKGLIQKEVIMKQSKGTGVGQTSQRAGTSLNKQRSLKKLYNVPSSQQNTGNQKRMVSSDQMQQKYDHTSSIESPEKAYNNVQQSSKSKTQQQQSKVTTTNLSLIIDNDKQDNPKVNMRLQQRNTHNKGTGTSSGGPGIRITQNQKNLKVKQTEPYQNQNQKEAKVIVIPNQRLYSAASSSKQLIESVKQRNSEIINSQIDDNNLLQITSIEQEERPMKFVTKSNQSPIGYFNKQKTSLKNTKQRPSHISQASQASQAGQIETLEYSDNPGGIKNSQSKSQLETVSQTGFSPFKQDHKFSDNKAKKDQEQVQMQTEEQLQESKEQVKEEENNKDLMTIDVNDDDVSEKINDIHPSVSTPVITKNDPSTQNIHTKNQNSFLNSNDIMKSPPDINNISEIKQVNEEFTTNALHSKKPSDGQSYFPDQAMQNLNITDKNFDLFQSNTKESNLNQGTGSFALQSNLQQVKPIQDNEPVYIQGQSIQQIQNQNSSNSLLKQNEMSSKEIVQQLKEQQSQSFQMFQQQLQQPSQVNNDTTNTFDQQHEILQMVQQHNKDVSVSEGGGTEEQQYVVLSFNNSLNRIRPDTSQTSQPKIVQSSIGTSQQQVQYVRNSPSPTPTRLQHLKTQQQQKAQAQAQKQPDPMRNFAQGQLQIKKIYSKEEVRAEEARQQKMLAIKQQDEYFAQKLKDGKDEVFLRNLYLKNGPFDQHK